MYSHQGPVIIHSLILHDHSNPVSPQPTLYPAYRYRFVITALFSLIAIVNAIMWICTSPILTNLEDIYGLSLQIVHLCTTMIWFIVYPPMNFAANYVLDELGLRAGVFCGATLTLLGLWLRTLSSHSFYYIFAGQLLAALGQPFLMNAPQKLSAVWYPSHERALSTTVASLANPVGVGIGFVMAQNFVDDDAKGNSGLQQVYHLMLFNAVLGSVLIIPSYFLFRNKPPTPPSKAADTEKYSYKKSLSQLLKSRNYLLFIISSGLIYGAYNVVGTSLEPLLAPYGFSSSNAGDLGAISLGMGLIGSLMCGFYVDRTKKFKRILVCCAVLSVIALGGIFFIAKTGNFTFLAMVTGVYGFFTTPILPLSYELCAELSFPVAEAASGGLMVVMTQIVGAVGTVGADQLLKVQELKESELCFLVMGGITTLGFLGYLLVKEDLKRTKMENRAFCEVKDGDMVKGEHMGSTMGSLSAIPEH